MPEGEAKAGIGRVARGRHLAVYASLLMIATSGLAYELALGAAESLLLGDPVVQFALIIGVYMTSLGAGAWASSLIRTNVDGRCVQVLLVTALVGGLSGPLLLLVFAGQGPFRAAVFALTVGLGVLVGLQLPLMMRILRGRQRFEDALAGALAVDYVGALAGSLCFSLLLMPWLGLLRTTLVLGLLDALGAALLTWAIREPGVSARSRVASCAVVAGVLIAMISVAARVEGMLEGDL